MAKHRWYLHAQIACPLWNALIDPKKQDPFELRHFTPFPIDGHGDKAVVKVNVGSLKGLFKR